MCREAKIILYSRTFNAAYLGRWWGYICKTMKGCQSRVMHSSIGRPLHPVCNTTSRAVMRSHSVITANVVMWSSFPRYRAVGSCSPSWRGERASGRLNEMS